MKILANGNKEKLVIEIEPDGHDAKTMRSGRTGFFARKKIQIKGKMYLVQVLGYSLSEVAVNEASPQLGE